MDHDQRFKVLLKEFFAEFFGLFFPELADHLDFDTVDWLDQEVFADPPQGEKTVLDLVAQVGIRSGPGGPRSDENGGQVVLVHVE